MQITKENAKKALKWHHISYSKGEDEAFVPYLVLDSFLKEDLPLDDCDKVIGHVQKLSAEVFDILQTRHSVKKNLKVCHYTQYDHLKNMLEDKEKSRLRMYNVRYCNDPTEGNYFFERARDRFDGRPHSENPFHFFAPEREQKLLVSTYILSLCDNTDSDEKEDNLNLWNLHGKRGKGVCITFDVPKENLGSPTIRQDLKTFSKMFDDDAGSDAAMTIYRIVYGTEECHKTIEKLEPQLKAIEDFVEEKFNKMNFIEQLLVGTNYKNVMKKIVWSVLGSLPYLYKDGFYEYEQECRIIRHFLPEDKKLKSDELYNPPRLYYETQLGLLEAHDGKNPCTIILGYAIEDKEGTRDYLAHQLRRVAEDKPIPAIAFSKLRY